ncbi:MAG: hypothetical protein V7L01_19240 [Nostoc sp.]|uniref:hypothetical protein n=1 Tax=Nostoc sp. TaxID=1180 RepID=UPI002FFC1154
MNKFAKVLLLALIVAAPVTVFASQAQAATHTASVKSTKVHHKTHHKTHHKHHAKNVAPKTYKK